MLTGHAPFHVQSGDNGAAVLAKVTGGSFNFSTEALSHISSGAKCVMEGKNSDKYRIFSNLIHTRFTVSEV
jgi:hypothetical protein